MRVLIYKRTHNGDPDRSGHFGIHDCMGSVRNHEFDAVIGVGGIGSEAQSNGIDGQIIWIGVGVHKAPLRGGRGPIITFVHFVEYGIDGPDFRSVARHLRPASSVLRRQTLVPHASANGKKAGRILDS